MMEVIHRQELSLLSRPDSRLSNNSDMVMNSNFFEISFSSMKAEKADMPKGISIVSDKGEVEIKGDVANWGREPSEHPACRNIISSYFSFISDLHWRSPSFFGIIDGDHLLTVPRVVLVDDWYFLIGYKVAIESLDIIGSFIEPITIEHMSYVIVDQRSGCIKVA